MTNTESTNVDRGREDAARHAERIAEALRDNADRIDRHAAQLRRPGRAAAEIVADVLSEYEQNQVGPIVWQLVVSLRDADHER